MPPVKEEPPAKQDGGSWVPPQLLSYPTITFCTDQAGSSTELVSDQSTPPGKPEIKATEGNIFKDISTGSEKWQKKSGKDEDVSELPHQLVRKWSPTLTLYPSRLP